MYAGKRYNSRSNLTKRYKLDRVAPVDNRPPPDKNFGPKQMWVMILVYSRFCVEQFEYFHVTSLIKKIKQGFEQIFVTKVNDNTGICLCASVFPIKENFA